MRKALILSISLLLSIVSQAQINTIAQDDYIYVNLGEIVSFDPTVNDIDTLGNPVLIDTAFSNEVEIISYSGKNITFKMLDFSERWLRVRYRLQDTVSQINVGANVTITPNWKFDTINCNQIESPIYPYSLQFWDFFKDDDYLNSSYFYPKGEQTSTIFSYCLWLGGRNANTDSLHLAAERYRQIGTDFWPGPLSVDGYASTDSINAGKWMRTWKVSSDDIQYHLRNFNNPDYKIPEAIRSWPAHGDPDLNQAEFLAPFVDVDLDREYHPEKGDYPLIKGDQAIFFIFNDQITHTESEGKPIGVEIHCMVWATNLQREKSALNSTIFLSYKIFNRSMRTFNDFYFGPWTDLDLGCAFDDYIGCNVEDGYYYVYNGREIDGAGEPESYGENPPSQAICILGGPFMDYDQFDNPDGECDESINGVGFGDGIIDNERLGMSYFLYHRNSGPWFVTDPDIAREYYQFLSGKWKDDMPMAFGGNAHYLNGGDSLFPTRFMWPGNSDPCHWGTNGLEPSWDSIWTEETTGNQPSDRRGLGSTGPFTFEAGSVEYLDIALVTAPGEEGKNSKELLEEYVEAIRAEYIKNPEDFGNQYLGAEDVVFEKREAIHIFPNPIQDEDIFFSLPHEEEAVYRLYNTTGQLVKQGFLKAQKQHKINVSVLPRSWYILEVVQNNKLYRTKIILL
jgi:hypothetical protein